MSVIGCGRWSRYNVLPTVLVVLLCMVVLATTNTVDARRSRRPVDDLDDDLHVDSQDHELEEDAGERGSEMRLKGEEDGEAVDNGGSNRRRNAKKSFRGSEVEGSSGFGGETERLDDDPVHERSLDHLSKQERIFAYEEQANAIVQTEVAPAQRALAQAQMQHNMAKQNQGWFASEEERRRVASLDREVTRANAALVKAQSRELAIRQKIKPLYGLVSYEFVREQRESIVGSIKKVNKMAYDQAWWSSLWDMHRRDSLQDVIIGFFVQWLLIYSLMYPFAVLYYAFWTAPWSIVEYMSSWQDLGTGVLMWFIAVCIMCLPAVALFFCCKVALQFSQRHRAQFR